MKKMVWAVVALAALGMTGCAQKSESEKALDAFKKDANKAMDQAKKDVNSL
jgi:hypothetical protein